MRGRTDLPRLLKRLYRFREAARRGSRLLHPLRRRRKAALQAALRRDWPGAYALTDDGELVFVPAPLEARGEHLLFYGCDMPRPALSFVAAGGVAVDIGANLGEWAVPLAKAVGAQGRVVCCEPNPAAAAALVRTLEINNLHQARVVEVAVSDRDGDGHLAIDQADSGQSRLAGAGVAVRLRRLDALVAELALDRIDLVKIDVEGHEAAVLAGAAATLRQLRPALIFEAGHEAPGDRERIAALLHETGYRLVAVLHHHGALPCEASDYLTAAGPCAGAALNLLALPIASRVNCRAR